MTPDKHEAFKRAYAAIPDQVYVPLPDRGSFKAGFFAGWDLQAERIAAVEHAHWCSETLRKTYEVESARLSERVNELECMVNVLKASEASSSKRVKELGADALADNRIILELENQCFLHAERLTCANSMADKFADEADWFRERVSYAERFIKANSGSSLDEVIVWMKRQDEESLLGDDGMGKPDRPLTRI